MMQWDSWAAFWSMGGRGGFVWGSYGALVLLVLTECGLLARRRRRALRRLATLNRRPGANARAEGQR